MRRRRGRKKVLRIRKCFTPERSTNQPTMTTLARSLNPDKRRKHTDDAYGAVRMTRSLSGVPFDCRTLYDVRNNKGRLMGRYPELAVKLAHHGAPPADVLFPLHNLEREVMDVYGKTVNAPLSDLQRDETDAQNRLDKAQLEVAALPKDKRAIEAAAEAAREQIIATELLSAKLAEMESAL